MASAGLGCVASGGSSGTKMTGWSIDSFISGVFNGPSEPNAEKMGTDQETK